MDTINNIDEIDNYFTPQIIKPEPVEIEDVIIGIDLGTTNSCVAIWRKNNLEIIPDSYGNRTIPSVVSFTSKSKYVGREAKKQIELNPENSFYEVKRLIGRNYDDENVINDKEFLSYEIGSDEQNNVVIKPKLPHKKYITPEEISSNILTELKHMAEHYLNQEIEKVVVTVPAYFGDAQRQATKDACEIAGLECVRIINEPTAAALAYGFDKRSGDVNILIYDLGGGTLDVSLLNVSQGIFQVLGCSGNTHLGGADFDNLLMTYSIEQFKKKYKICNLENLNPISFQKLKQSCENAKKRLSEINRTTIIVPDFYDDKDLFITITKEIFESICKELFILCLRPVDDILKSCNMSKDLIDEIVLVGGCTRMPQIKNNLTIFFNGKEPNTSVNPDEVVAAGAAIQGYILSHKSDPFSENITLLDVIPLSLGVETIGGVMNVLIPRNSVIPITKKRKYTNDTDDETFITVKIFEGERKMTMDNFLVGEFELSGIAPMLRGINQFEITFAIDVNGIINVTAKDLANDNRRTLTINSNKGRLSIEKIKELVEEAKNCEVIDRIEREKKTLFYTVEDLLCTIKANVENPEFQLKEIDKNVILLYVNNTLEYLKQNTYKTIDKKEYAKLIEHIKAEYGTLIIKVTGELDDIKSKCSDNIGASSIYEDDKDEDTEIITKEIYEELENNELGVTNSYSKEHKEELKRMRELLVSLCYSVFDILSSSNNIIEKQNAKDLREYIDDILLWIYVKEKISIEDYKLKMEEVNNVCNDIVDKNINNEENIIINDYGKSELEQLCFVLLGGINANTLGIQNKEKITCLQNHIDSVLDFIINNDDSNENMYYDKINEINKMCDDIYENDSNYVKIELYENNLVLDEDNKNGTSIFSLLNKNKHL